MIRSVEFDLFTKIEANARFASKQGMFAKSKRTADQRAAVRAVLMSSFGALVPPRYVQTTTALVRNKIAVKLTRIAPGRTADAWENLRGALKGIKDEVAKWCGFDDKEGAGITWLDPGQEQRGQHVYRVCIEITDDAPGPDRVVVLAETASHGRAAASRVKREVKAAGTRHGVTVYRPEAGARAASSAARGKAEGAFAKLTGKPTDVIENPTVEHLRGLAERVLGPGGAARIARPDAPCDCPVGGVHRPGEHGSGCAYKAGDLYLGKRIQAHRDPGEERPARDLAACTTCGAKVGEPCDVAKFAKLSLVYGVHVERAIAAGLPVNGRRGKAPTNGHRRIVPPAQAPLPLPAAYVRLPWLAPGLIRDPRLDGEQAPPTAHYNVPAEHRARFGREAWLRQRRTTLTGIGEVWLYE